MSNNIQITIEPRSISVNLKPNCPDGPLRFTYVYRTTKNDPCEWEENGLSFNSARVLRYTITPGVPTGDGDYAYYLVMDFSVTHESGANQTVFFNNNGINDFVPSSRSVLITLLASNGFFIMSGGRGNIDASTYWSYRKALPYPILG